MKNYFFIALLVFTSCSNNKTYLTEQEKEINPYKEGQNIVFKSNNGQLDSIYIKQIKHQFPDGIGVINKYEILSVVGEIFEDNINKTSSNYLFSIHAKTKNRGTRLEFGLSINNSKFYSNDYYMKDEIMNFSKSNFSVSFGDFDDVIVIENKNDYSKVPNAIKLFYWSKSKGYIKFEEYNGTIWELVDIKE